MKKLVLITYSFYGMTFQNGKFCQVLLSCMLSRRIEEKTFLRRIITSFVIYVINFCELWEKMAYIFQIWVFLRFCLSFEALIFPRSLRWPFVTQLFHPFPLIYLIRCPKSLTPDIFSSVSFPYLFICYSESYLTPSFPYRIYIFRRENVR